MSVCFTWFFYRYPNSGYYCYLSFFFLKQKPADEMRISDWSSDVCASDLIAAGDGVFLQLLIGVNEDAHASDMIRHTRGKRCCFVEVDVARALTEEHHADVRRPCVNGGIYGFGRRKAAYLDGDSGHGRGVDRPANICTTLMRTVKEWPRSPGRRGQDSLPE